jgi:hypothetical protein
LRSGQAEWSGRWYGVQKTGKGQKPGGLAKENSSRSTGKPLVDLKGIQDELAQRDRKHKDIYPREISDTQRVWRQSQDR